MLTTNKVLNGGDFTPTAEGGGSLSESLRCACVSHHLVGNQPTALDAMHVSQRTYKQDYMPTKHNILFI